MHFISKYCSYLCKLIGSCLNKGVMPTSLRYKKPCAGGDCHCNLGNLLFALYPDPSQLLPPWLASFAVEATSQAILAMEPTSTGPTEPPPWTVLCPWALPSTMVTDAMAMAPWAIASEVATLATCPVAMVAAVAGHGAQALALATAPTEETMAPGDYRILNQICSQNDLKNDCLPVHRCAGEIHLPSSYWVLTEILVFDDADQVSQASNAELILLYSQRKQDVLIVLWHTWILAVKQVVCLSWLFCSCINKFYMNINVLQIGCG